MTSEQYKIFFWGLLLIGVPGFFVMKKEIENLKASNDAYAKAVSLGIRG
jgi:hypothetical protein